MALLRLGDELYVPDDEFEANPVPPRMQWLATVVRVFRSPARADKNKLKVLLFFHHDRWKIEFDEGKARQWARKTYAPENTEGHFLGKRVEVYWGHDRKWYKATITQIKDADEVVLVYDDEGVRAHKLQLETWRSADEPACKPLPEHLLPLPQSWVQRGSRKSKHGAIVYGNGSGYGASTILEAWSLHWSMIDQELAPKPKGKPAKVARAGSITEVPSSGAPSKRPLINVPPAVPRRCQTPPLLNLNAPKQGEKITIWFPMDAKHIEATVTEVQLSLESEHVRQLTYCLVYRDGGPPGFYNEGELLWQVTVEEAARREVRAEFGCEFQPDRISWLAGHMQAQLKNALGPAKREELRQLEIWCRAYCAATSQAAPHNMEEQDDLRTLRSIEIGSGSSRLSRTLHSTHGWEVTLVECNDAHIAWQPPFTRDHERVLLWNVDYTKLDSDQMPCYDAIHASPDCETFSQEATGTHQRCE